VILSKKTKRVEEERDKNYFNKRIKVLKGMSIPNKILDHKRIERLLKRINYP